MFERFCFSENMLEGKLIDDVVLPFARLLHFADFVDLFKIYLRKMYIQVILKEA